MAPEQIPVEPPSSEPEEVREQETMSGPRTEANDSISETPESTQEGKEEFDIEESKQEYAEVRLGWARSEAEYNHLSE